MKMDPGLSCMLSKISKNIRSIAIELYNSFRFFFLHLLILKEVETFYTTSTRFLRNPYFFRLVWIYYIIQLQFKRVFVPQFMWVMFVKRQWSIPSNPYHKSGNYLNHQKWLEIDKCSIFQIMIILRHHSYITSVHFSTFFYPPTLC